MRGLIVLILMMFPMLSDAATWIDPGEEDARADSPPSTDIKRPDEFIFIGAGKIDSIDYSKMVIIINKMKYSMNPYFFEATVDGVNIPTYLLEPGLRVKFYSMKRNKGVSRIEISDKKMKDILVNR